MTSMNPAGKSSITVLVCGDGGVGKTSLISSLVSENFNERVPPVLQPVMVPPSLMPEFVQLTIIDTSSDPEHEPEIRMHLQSNTSSQSNAAFNLNSPLSSSLSSSLPSANSKAALVADAVLLVVASDVVDSFARVESYWLPLIESQVGRNKIPVILAINKSAPEDGASAAVRALQLDLDESYSSLPPAGNGSASATHPFRHLLHSFRLSAVYCCSAKYMYNINQIFFACNLVTLSPIDPLFDMQSTSRTASSASASLPPTMRFKLLTQKALLRIFRLFDQDCDGVLSFHELDLLHQVNFRGKTLAAPVWEQLIRLLLNQGSQRGFVRAINSTQPGAGGPSKSASNAASSATVVPASNYLSSSPSPPSTGFNPASYGITFAGLLYFHYSFLLQHHHAWKTWSLIQPFGYAAQPNQNANVQSSVANPLTTNLSQSMTSNRQSITPASSASISSPALSSTSSSNAVANIMPSLGSVFLKDSYATLPFPFNSQLTYELTSTAINFLTEVFHRFDTDHDGLLAIRSGGSDELNPTHPSVATVFGALNTASAGSEKSASISHHHRSISTATGVSVSTSSSSNNPAISASALASASASICSLHASSELENLFLTSPDIPFSLNTFSQFVPLSPNGLNFLTLDSWLACWALLLYNYSTVPLPLPTVQSTPTLAPLSAPASAASSSTSASSSTNASNVSIAFTPAVAVSSRSQDQLVPNPDILLRYLAYLCYPVVPSHPEFTVNRDPRSNRVIGKQYLPKITRCIHVTPKSTANRSAVEAAMNANELILSSDPTVSIGSIRGYVSDSVALKPRTVTVFVMGSSGSGKSSLVDCMLGKSPAGTSSFSQPIPPGVLPGWKGANTSSTKSTDINSSEPSTPSGSSTPGFSSFPSSSTASHPRTYAAKLPLSHLPASANSAPAASPASTSPFQAVESENKFLIVKEIPAAIAPAMLSGAAFTNSSCNLLILVYDGTSPHSVQFTIDRLHTCFQKSIPVLVVQTHVDCINCSIPQQDFAAVDYPVHVEPFSPKVFWHARDVLCGVSGGVVGQNPVVTSTADISKEAHVLQIFQRIHQAAVQPSAYVLTSLSAAARSSKLTRRFLMALLAVGGTVTAYVAYNYWQKQSQLPMLASSVISTQNAVTIVEPVSVSSAPVQPTAPVAQPSSS